MTEEYKREPLTKDQKGPKRSRNYVYTQWDNFELKPNMDQIKYFVHGEEVCPKTKRPHLQGYLELFNAKSIGGLRKYFPDTKIYFAPRRGNQEQAIAYCKKDLKFTEGGTPNKQGQRNDLEQIKNDIKQGATELDIAENHFTQWCQYRRSFKRYRDLIEPKRNWETEVILITGKTGTGKTSKAINDGAVIVDISTGAQKFIMNYNGEDTICFDDIDPSTFPRALFLKLTDRYALSVEIKGGSRNWKPKKIYLTSNYTKEDLFGSDEAMERRITKHLVL